MIGAVVTAVAAVFFRTIAFNSINVRQMQKVNQNELRSVSADIRSVIIYGNG